MELPVEQHIIHHLLLRSSLGKDVGLYHGKMGLILFFAHYFRHVGLQLYEDTADELMDELKKEIHTELPTGFAYGYAGVGWGIEYLIQNGFVTDDSQQICREIDQKIMANDPRRINDYSLDTGLEGILHYVLAHIKGVMTQHSNPPFDERYMSDLFQTVSTLPQDIELQESFKILVDKYSAYYENRAEVDYSFQLPSFLEEVKFEQEGLSRFSLGLKKGMSGYLLNKLFEERL